MDTKVYDRPINTLQAMMDNSKLGDVMTVYEDGDYQVYCNWQMPKKFLHKDGSVKCENGLMLFDEEEVEIAANNPQDVFNYLDDCLIFDTDMNCTPEQLTQVLDYFETFGVKVNRQDYL